MRMRETEVFSAGPPSERNAVIARGLHRREPALLDRLVREHQARLFRYLLAVTRDWDTAEDLLQETWVRALGRAEQYKAIATFEAWLRAIARHLVIDLARQRARDRNLDRPLDEDQHPLPEPAARDVFSPFELASRRQDAARVHAALRRLSHHLQVVCLLRFFGGFRLEEIAARLGVPSGTVKSRLHRGLASLRASLGGCRARMVERRG